MTVENTDTAETLVKIDKKIRSLPSTDPSNLTLIGEDTDDKEEHPLYDPRVKNPPNKSLMLNIMSLGVLEPVLVRETVSHDGTTLLEVIAGRQRVLAARAANVILRDRGETPIKVPYIVKRTDESTAMGIMLSENTHRTDDDLMVKAAKAQKFIAMDGSSAAIEHCANYFGVTTATIGVWLKINELHPDVRVAMRENKIAASAAVKLAKLPKEEQYDQLNKLLGGNEGASIARVEATVKKAKKAKGKKPTEEDDSGLMPLTTGQMRRLLKYWLTEGADTVKPEVINFVRVAVGDLSPKKISGLYQSMKAAGLVGEE